MALKPNIQIAQRGRPLGSSFSQWVNFRLVPFAAFLLHRVLMATLRVERQGFEAVDQLVKQDERFVLCFWHRRLVMMPLAYPFRRRDANRETRGVAILSSDSKDGERSAATWRWYGIHAVRGTTGHSGAQALVKMIQIVKQGWDLGITLDGPRGPRQEAKPGVIAVSRKTGAWLVPVCVAYERAWQLNTWDAMLVPHPFSKVTVRYETPFQHEDPARDDLATKALEGQLNAMETWAEVGRG
ncbi:MAG: lysophospholipid acyltransferase family protein [Firmicutes bacterium]|nr:lysophospholipid acyltransferase family protein [Bacillota bacterium]